MYILFFLSDDVEKETLLAYKEKLLEFIHSHQGRIQEYINSKEFSKGVTARSIYDTIHIDDILLLTVDSGEEISETVIPEILSENFKLQKKLLYPQCRYNFETIINHFVISEFIKYIGKCILHIFILFLAAIMIIKLLIKVIIQRSSYRRY